MKKFETSFFTVEDVKRMNYGLKVPLEFFKTPEFNKLSSKAVVLYILISDKLNYEIRDEKNICYVKFDLEEAKKVFENTTDEVELIFNELLESDLIKLKEDRIYLNMI